jgi:hypothetical protein
MSAEKKNLSESGIPKFKPGLVLRKSDNFQVMFAYKEGIKDGKKVFFYYTSKIF